ncbi:MAG: ribonuclease III [Brevinematia bacterium]
MIFRKIPNLPKERILDLLKFEKEINVKFRDIGLLHQSLLHSSYVKNNPSISVRSNERIEFVGDAVISMIISEYLYKKYPLYSEGMLSAIKSDVVSRKVMYKIGTEIKIEKYILTSPPLDKFDQRGQKTIISNCLESLIGAIFLSNGLESARDFTLRIFLPVIEKRIKDGTEDYKGQLQKISLYLFDTYPKYSVVSEIGPNHNKEFIVKVSVKDKDIAQGKGSSKREAEQSAAKNALEILKKGNYITHQKYFTV